jgi:threonine dehydrogenase-like Zn-dependent dehydrogenase
MHEAWSEARAFWIVAPGRGELRTERVRTPAEGEVLVRTLYSGISRGTESLVFRGDVPRSEYERMRAPFQEGQFPGPVKYGYCNVGFVEWGPSHLQGREVFSLYPHQDRFVVPASAVHLLPPGVPPARAVLAANLETAVNGVWDAEVQPGDRVHVIGAGTVGCLVAWLLRARSGVTCTLSDINPSRAAIAGALDVQFALPDALPGEADVVVHTSGSPEGLQRALEVTARDGTVLEMSWYGDRMVSLPLGREFHSRRLTIKSSQVGSIPPSRRGRWTFERRLDFALGLLQDRALDALVTGESAFDSLPAVMERLSAGSSGTLTHRIAY